MGVKMPSCAKPTSPCFASSRLAVKALVQAERHRNDD
jgi:hypothetical protein